MIGITQKDIDQVSGGLVGIVLPQPIPGPEFPFPDFPVPGDPVGVPVPWSGTVCPIYNLP